MIPVQRGLPKPGARSRGRSFARHSGGSQPRAHVPGTVFADPVTGTEKGLIPWTFPIGLDESAARWRLILMKFG